MTRRALRLFAAVLMTATCVGPQAAPTPATPTTGASVSAAPAAPTAEATPTVGTTPVPTLVPVAAYAQMKITLDVERRLGQPAQSPVWRVTPFRPDDGYAARVSVALGMPGPGTAGVSPAGASPWRLWFGPDLFGRPAKVLAVNETSGEVFFFDPSANDGPPGPGSARHDPAFALQGILGSFGWSGDLAPSHARITAFRGTEASASRIEPLVSGPWNVPGHRDTAVLFPSYPSPVDPAYRPGTTIYDVDQLGLLTSAGRPAAIIHRPIGGLASGEIYWITHYGQAVDELRAAPSRYLRFLSDPSATAVTLTVRPEDVTDGSAWAGGSPTDLTHSRKTLVPVWVFPASGTTAEGTPVSAIFVVDAVVPERRAPLAGSALNVDADSLLRDQLATMRGQTSLNSARGSALQHLGSGCTEPDLQGQDADAATGTATCNGVTIRFTVKRAFPGLPRSIWFVSAMSR